jgi:hypothetical protein
MNGPLQVILGPHPSLAIGNVEGYPVISCEDTIMHMRDHCSQFQLDC